VQKYSLAMIKWLTKLSEDFPCQLRYDHCFALLMLLNMLSVLLLAYTVVNLLLCW